VRKALPAAELCQVLVELDRHLCTDLELPLQSAPAEAPVNLQQALATRPAARAG